MEPERLPYLRPVVAAITVFAGLVAAGALLSDRVPVMLGIARNRFDAPGWFPWTLDDTAFHLAIWLGITLLATLAVRTTFTRLIAGVSVAAGSLLLEYLQIQWTSTRHFEISDVVANTKGVYLGLLLGLIAGGVVDAIEDHRRRSERETA